MTNLRNGMAVQVPHVEVTYRKAPRARQALLPGAGDWRAQPSPRGPTHLVVDRQATEVLYQLKHQVAQQLGAVPLKHSLLPVQAAWLGIDATLSQAHHQFDLRSPRTGTRERARAADRAAGPCAGPAVCLAPAPPAPQKTPPAPRHDDHRHTPGGVSAPMHIPTTPGDLEAKSRLEANSRGRLRGAWSLAPAPTSDAPRPSPLGCSASAQDPSPAAQVESSQDPRSAQVKSSQRAAQDPSPAVAWGLVTSCPDTSTTPGPRCTTPQHMVQPRACRDSRGDPSSPVQSSQIQSSPVQSSQRVRRYSRDDPSTLPSKYSAWVKRADALHSGLRSQLGAAAASKPALPRG